MKEKTKATEALLSHTPGPWFIQDQMLKENGEVLEHTGYIVCPHCGKHASEQPASIEILTKKWGVARIGSFDPKHEHEQHLRNAWLIFAAPDLLTQLNALCDQLRAAGLVIPPGVTAAIHKAEHGR